VVQNGQDPVCSLFPRGHLHQAVEKKLEDLRGRLKTLIQQRDALPEGSAREFASQIHQRLPAGWKETTPLHRRKLVRAFFDSITVGDGSLKLMFRISASPPKVVASDQQKSAPTKAPTTALKPGAPIYIRLPKSGNRCPYSG
jgi:hypothetical protein